MEALVWEKVKQSPFLLRMGSRHRRNDHKLNI